MALDTHTAKLLVHAIELGYATAIAMNRARLHRDVVVQCRHVLGKDVVAKHIWRCFQLACDLLRASDAREEYVDSLANVGVQDRYQILVWFRQHDAQKNIPVWMHVTRLHLQKREMKKSCR